MSLNDVIDLFNLPLSQIAFSQMQQIQYIMEATQLEDDEDIWTYTGGSTKFSSSRVYRKLIGHHQPETTF